MVIMFALSPAPSHFLPTLLPDHLLACFCCSCRRNTVHLGLQLTTASKAVYDSRFSPPRLVGVIGIDILSSDLEDVAADYNQLLSALVQRSNTCPVLALDRCELSVIRTTDYSTSGLPSQYSETDRLCEPGERDGCNITTRLPCASDGNIYTAPSISATEETDPHFGTQRSSYNSEVGRLLDET